MVTKLHEYEGVLGRFHGAREEVRERWARWRESRPTLREFIFRQKSPEHKADAAPPDVPIPEYAHVYRKKTRWELIRISAAVMGIEFAYAGETAFTSPLLLSIGVQHRTMTLVWALSPLAGLLLTPLLGSLSDRCRLRWGRRRPFIALLSIGLFLGLLLVPNGEDLGYMLGDRPENMTTYNVTTEVEILEESEFVPGTHSWAVFFTILGTLLLDFDADACQSPARAYLLDVIVEEDHAKGLSTFTVMAGVGGAMGYTLGAVNWDDTVLGELLGGQVRVVFLVITIIFVVCIIATVTSFAEIPLDVLEAEKRAHGMQSFVAQDERATIKVVKETSYGSLAAPGAEAGTTPTAPTDSEAAKDKVISGETSEPISLKDYLKTIIIMPYSLKIVCLTNFFCWSAHVSYSLYFTDFVGEAVFGGNPSAPNGSDEFLLYNQGVRFGCWGMAMYALSCAIYSLVIEKCIKKVGARCVYVGGLLVYSVGMTILAVWQHRVGVLIFSCCAGMLYCTLFTMPYILVAHYHTKSTFEVNSVGEPQISRQVRGLGTDVAVLSSMVFVAQLIVSLCMGSLVHYAGSTAVVVGFAAAAALAGAISATRIIYLDL